MPRKKTSLSPRKQKTPALDDHREPFKTESHLHSIPESLDAESVQLATLDGEEDQAEESTESGNSTHVDEIDPEHVAVRFLTSRYETVYVYKPYGAGAKI